MVWRGNIKNKVGKGSHHKFECAWEIHKSQQDDALHYIFKEYLCLFYVCSNENRNSQNLTVMVSLPK